MFCWHALTDITFLHWIIMVLHFKNFDWTSGLTLVCCILHFLYSDVQLNSKGLAMFTFRGVLYDSLNCLVIVMADKFKMSLLTLLTVLITQLLFKILWDCYSWCYKHKLSESILKICEFTNKSLLIKFTYLISNFIFRCSISSTYIQ